MTLIPRPIPTTPHRRSCLWLLLLSAELLLWPPVVWGGASSLTLADFERLEDIVSHRFLVDNIRAVHLDEGLPESILSDPFYRRLEPCFGRGVNLGNALEAPREGEWGVRLEEKYFELIKAAGFDSVRIPVRWSAHAGESAPFAIQPDFLRRVDWAVEQALSRGLSVVLNMHHYDGLVEDPERHRARFIALWDQLARHYKDQPAALAFELLNEPHGKLDAACWNRMLADALKVVRLTNPERQIVVGPVGWNSIKELPNLELPQTDRHLVVTFHYYSPFHFTHQGASWAGAQANEWLGTKWTGAKEERLAVDRDLDAAITWAVQHRRPIYMGEFGAYSKADIESRARWTRCLADAALTRKIGFAYWEFCAGFGVYDSGRGQWNESLKEALFPTKK